MLSRMRTLWAVAGFWLAAPLVSAFAAPAKPVSDPRPLPPVTVNAVPAYPTLSAFLDASRAQRLLLPTGSRLAGSLPKGAVSAGYAPRLAVMGQRALAQRTDALPPMGAIARLQRAENGTARWLEGRLGSVTGATMNNTSARAGIVLPPADIATRALAALKPYASLMGLADPATELRLRNTQTESNGWTHLRFDQVYQGIPVWGRDLYVHVDPAGEVRIVNGAYSRTPLGVDTAAVRTADDAFATVRGDLSGAGRWAPVSENMRRMLGYEDPQKELVIFDDHGSPRLAWAVSVRPNLIEWWQYLVDAHTGAILARIQQFCDATFQDSTGTDLNGKSQSFRSWKNDQNSSYLLWDLSNFVAANSTLPDTMAGGIMTLDLRNQDPGQGVNIYYVNSTDNTWKDPSSVSAHLNAQLAFNYYATTFTRKAIDDKDSTIISVIHVTQGGVPMDNAYWNGRAMFYGDGDQVFKPLAGGLDVAAHEMSHGVIGNSAGLKYQDQSGALNESFADVFATFVDRDDYLIGEDVMKPGEGIALRDMENPEDPQVYSPQPGKMVEYDHTTSDNGGVHTNSGIPNHAAALIMKAIGKDKAEKIYYRALTMYLTSTSQFVDCRNAVEQATKDLFPTGTTELSAVKSAFDTVGITIPVTPPPGGGEKIPPVTGGTPYVAFAKDDGSVGYMDVETGNIWTFNSTDAKARVTKDTLSEDRAQLTTPLDGSAIWFANQTGHLAFAQMSDGQVFTFPNLKLNQDGDIWNASVAPDGTYVSLVSSSRSDRSLYILDLLTGWMGRITLEPETTQDGVHDLSILYPDVVSWSPNMGLPKIGFDALHEVTVNNQAAQYWGIAEINFGLGRIYDLVPGQPSGTAVGNVTYSNTDPNTLALNQFETTLGYTITDVMMYRGGALEALNLPLWQVNGSNLNDSLRPTFSPDDKRLAFTVPSLSLLCLYVLDAKTLSAWTMPWTVYNPRWFVVGGNVPYTFADAARALQIASGLFGARDVDMARLNLATGGDSATKILDDDAIRIARKVTGVAP